MLYDDRFRRLRNAAFSLGKGVIRPWGVLSRWESTFLLMVVA
jgi:hypothetical protein